MSQVPESFKEIELGIDPKEADQKDLEALYKKLRMLNMKDGLPNAFALGNLLNESIGSGSTALILAYFPEGGDIFLTGDMEIKGNINKRTERFEANIIFRKYLRKHDTRKEPVFPTVEDYEDAKMRGDLNIGKFEYYRVLRRKVQYFVHIQEPEEA